MPPCTASEVENVPRVPGFYVIREFLNRGEGWREFLPSSLFPCQLPGMRAIGAHPVNLSLFLGDEDDAVDLRLYSPRGLQFFLNPLQVCLVFSSVKLWYYGSALEPVEQVV